MTKAVRRTVGDVLEVPLGDGWHSYARVLPEASMAFYDSRDRDTLAPSEIIGLPVLFIVPVMHSAIKTGRWPRVGHIELEATLEDPPRFMQDQFNKNDLSLSEHGKIRPATKEECRGLERAAVWSAEHVEDRLRDYYAGVPNKWVESLRMIE